MISEYSVLMPLWSGEKICFLEQSLKSMINQTFPPHEYVFVIDQPISTEMDSLIKTLIKSHSRIHYVKAYHLSGLGLGALLKVGVEACTCTFVARMDSDDISLPDRCEKELKILNSSSLIAVVGSYLTEFDTSPDMPISIRKVPENGVEFNKFAKLRNPINHPTVMFRKSLILEVGNYNAFFSHCEDYELWYRIIKNGYLSYNIQESLLLFRTGKDFLERRSHNKNLNSYIKLKKIMRSDKFINLNEYLLSILIQYLFSNAPLKIKEKIYQQLRTKCND